MAESQITNVYARAMFEAAESAGTIEASGSDLAAFAGALRDSRELAAVLYNPQVDTVTKKRVVADLTQGADRIFVNSINLMIDKLHADLILDLNDEYQRLLKKEKRLVDVDITTAVELPDQVRAEIRKRIEDATGKMVEISEHVDESIIGGLILRFGDVIVDGSLKAKLAQLRGRLAQA